MTHITTQAEQYEATLVQLDIAIDDLTQALRSRNLEAVANYTDVLSEKVNDFSLARENLIIAIGAHEVPFDEALKASIGAAMAERIISQSRDVSAKQRTVQTALNNVTDMNFKLLSALKGGTRPGASQQGYGADGKNQTYQSNLGISASA